MGGRLADFYTKFLKVPQYHSQSQVHSSHSLSHQLLSVDAPVHDGVVLQHWASSEKETCSNNWLTRLVMEATE